MENKQAVTINNTSFVGNLAGWLAGFMFMAAGLVNTFYGNDTLFGLFIMAASVIFFPPVNTLLKKITGFEVPAFAKFLLAAFIIWAVLGVGELFAKIELMRTNS